MAVDHSYVAVQDFDSTSQAFLLGQTAVAVVVAAAVVVVDVVVELA